MKRIFCPEGLNLKIVETENEFFKSNEFYVSNNMSFNGYENIKIMSKNMQEDPNPDFFNFILVNTQNALIEFSKYQKTVLYFKDKLDHSHNFYKFNLVEGWFSPEEGTAIFNCIYNSNIQGVNVEIGSWKGKSTSWLSYASKLKNNDLICIDHFIGSPEHEDLKKSKQTTFTEFVNNLQALDLYDNITIIASKSQKAGKLIDKTIKFLFIDGNHNEPSNDLQYFERNLVSGSMVGFHDCGPRGTSGITDFMYSLVDSGEYEFVGLYFSLGVIIKK